MGSAFHVSGFCSPKGSETINGLPDNISVRASKTSAIPMGKKRRRNRTLEFNNICGKYLVEKVICAIRIHIGNLEIRNYDKEGICGECACSGRNTDTKNEQAIVGLSLSLERRTFFCHQISILSPISWV